MRVVIDSSGYVKRYVAEPGSVEAREVVEAASELGLCVLCLPEVVSALARMLLDGKLAAESYQQTKATLTADLADAVTLQLTPSVLATATLLLEGSRLRASDALHVACALEWHADLFVTADRRQAAAATAASLHVQFIGAES